MTLPITGAWLVLTRRATAHFKTVNDSLGHAGDDVLVGIARHPRRLPREEDVIGRLGGDEFVLVLAATDRAGAEHLVERIRVAIGTAGSRPRRARRR